MVVDMFSKLLKHSNNNNETLLQISKKYYFRGVKNSLHINFKKPVAALLFALMVFIYAEKAFHIHHNTHNNTQQDGIYEISNSTICSICDFTIAKDAELPAPVTIEIPATFFPFPDAKNGCPPPFPSIYFPNSLITTLAFNPFSATNSLLM